MAVDMTSSLTNLVLFRNIRYRNIRNRNIRYRIIREGAVSTPKQLRYLSPLHKAIRQISVWFERRMEGTGLMPQEGHLLSYLRRYAPCPVGEVALVFDLRGSTLTSTLDRLETRRLIARRANPEDRRSLLVELTRDGEQMADQIQKLVSAFENAVARRTSAVDEEGFRNVIAAIAAVTEVKLTRRDEVSASRTPSALRTRSRTR
jgi:DNA-binding MarR family transcriptional regulator